MINLLKLTTFKHYKIMKFLPNGRGKYPSPFNYNIKMKLSILFLSFAFLSMQANESYGQKTNISLHLDGVTVEQLIDKIENTTEFEFVYKLEDVDLQRIVSVNVRKVKIRTVLNQVFGKSKTSYNLKGKRVYLLERKSKANITVPTPKTSDAYTKEVQTAITGKVLDEIGAPLLGASIVEKGTNNGTTTDFDGNYSITITGADAILQISYIGYTLTEIVVGSQTKIDVQLTPDTAALDEVVIVGYGAQKKANLTGAVAKVEGVAINQRPITQGTQALQGLTPGVFINTNSGEPGNDDASINIRGIGTFNDSEPLVLIDGIEAPLANINPKDIETINILKDAASASIYGTRAANGVILITTKRGTEGDTKVTYNTSYSITSPTVLPKVVSDTRSYLETYVRAAEYSGRTHPFTPELIDELSALGGTNWVDDFVNTGIIEDHDLAISGGSKNIKYRFSNRYFNQEGYLKGDWFTKRYSTRLNVDMKINEKLRSGVSLAYTNTDSRQSPPNDPRTFVIDGVNGALNAPGNRFASGKGNFLYTILLVSPPNGVVFDEFGRYAGTGAESSRSQRDNPQGLIDNQWIDNYANELLGNAFLEFEPIQDLTFRYTVGVNYFQDYFQETRLQYEQYDRFGNRTAVRTPGSILRTREANTLNVTNWLQANYSKSFGNHNFSVMAGINQETSRDRRIATAETGFGSTSLVVPGNGTEISDIQNFSGDWALSSIFGRINYNYANKYLLEMNLRRDGSSRFGANNRYATFPGISAGYVISEEEFWKFDFINFMKLRASWGKLGVQSLQLYPFASEVTLGNDYNGNSGAALTKLGNPDLQWEETTTIDFGLDLGLFNGTVYLEADYFRKESDGILTQLNNPLTSGINSTAVTVNSANIVNEGWEIAFRTNHNIGDLKISTNFNVSNIKNEVTRINSALGDNEDRLDLGTAGDRNVWLIRGEAINAIYGHEFGGVFQVEDFNADGSLVSGIDYSFLGTPRPGDIKYTDQNGDNVIDETDRVVIGNRNPEWIYGMNLNLDYKGFDFGLFFQGVGKVNSWVNRYTGNFGHSGLREFWTNSWTEENRSNTIPRIWVDREGFNGQSIEGLGGQAMNSFWVIDQSYLRLKNIMLGYTFQRDFFEKANLPIESLRIYASGQNLLTFTGLDDLDPERSQFSNHFGGTLPQAKGYTFGLNLTF